MTIDLAPPASAVSVLPAPARPADPHLELLLFTVRPQLVGEASAAGIDGFVVDWERRGKARRQAGQGTQINDDTYEDLQAVRAATTRRVLCHINGFSPWTGRDVERALDGGADEVLLPMVTDPGQVDATLAHLAGRLPLGILVETQAGVRQAAELLRRPLSRVYVGLNDLRIDRGSSSLFAPLTDGTVDHVRECAGEMPFGVAGLTLPDRGAPVASRLLAAELARLDADFTFLRRSFLHDTAGQPLAPAVQALHVTNISMQCRSEQQRRHDRDELLAAVPAERRTA